MKRKAAYQGVYNRYIKRILDIVIAGFLICILWPVYLIISIAIFLEDGTPVFYRADRGGYRGRTFKICKFRSMVKNADKIGGGTTALHDPRITKIGNLLRKTKLDEIPQLGQVFLGKMSLVGPRPELPIYVSRYQGTEKDIIQVRPGITDFSSIEFINLDEIVGGDNAGVEDPYTPNGIENPIHPTTDDDIHRDHTFSYTWNTTYPEKMRRVEAPSGSGERGV